MAAVEISATPRGELRQANLKNPGIFRNLLWRSPLHPEGNCDIQSLPTSKGQRRLWRSPLHPEGNCDTLPSSSRHAASTRSGDLRYTPRGIATCFVASSHVSILSLVEISATPRGELRLLGVAYKPMNPTNVEISATPRGELRHDGGSGVQGDEWRSPLHPEGNCDSSRSLAKSVTTPVSGDLRYTPRGIAT